MNWDKVKEFFSTISIENIIPAVLILVVGIIVVKLLTKLLDRGLDKTSINRTVFTYLKTFLRITLYLLVVLIAAASLGIDVTSLIAIVSVISLAISLAVQNTLANVVSGLTILATHPFDVGECVQIGTEVGTIEELTMSYTKMRTFDGKRIYIPNNDVATARICNYTDVGMRRIEVSISASYQDDIEEVKKALLAAGDHPKRLQDEPFQACVNAYLDSGVEYILRLWVQQEDYADVRFAVLEQIKREFDARGISIPYPQMEVKIHNS